MCFHSVVWRGELETDVASAAAALRRGEVVAFPTETVYGLGADARRNDAVAKVFAAKGRPADNPLIVHVSSLSALEEMRLVRRPLSPLVAPLAEHFWPGPLTLVVTAAPRAAPPLAAAAAAAAEPDASGGVSPLVSAGLDTIGVRVPKHPVALALLVAAGVPVAAPSANVSGRPSPTTAAHVLRDLDGKLFGVVDGGEVSVGIESTVLDVSAADRPTVLRPGAITRRQLEAVLGRKVGMTSSAASNHTTIESAPRAPGMKYRHYAPKAPLRIVFGGEHDFVECIAQIRRKHGAQSIGVLSWRETCEALRARDERLTALELGPSGDIASMARSLYAALRVMDDCGTVDLILAQGVDDSSEGQADDAGLAVAVMNRLRKAAAGDDVL